MSFPPAPRAFAEFRMGFVLSRLTAGDAGARLDAVEGTLASLVRRWRAGASISPARDLRMAPPTLAALLQWVETEGGHTAPVIERLAAYWSGAVADPAVPAGWIRVFLDVGQRGPGSRRLAGGG
jgi:hypothetical protein